MTGQQIIGSVQPPKLPQIELGPFFEIARQNQQVKTNAAYPVTTSPQGGVLWCEGGFDFKGDVTGCFISSGHISMEAGAVIRSYTNAWPTIYVKSGGAEFVGQATIYGFTWVGGDLKFTGGGNIYYGPVFVTGLLNKGGNSDMKWFIPSSGYVISPPRVSPQQYTNTLQRLVVTGWQ